jgi:CheY-like chemotaxis protein
MACPSVHLLVVEDDGDIREALWALLEEEGYSVALAANGKEALAKLDPLPAVILLDLMMPVMDGFTFLETLRRDPAPQRAQIPVILITAAPRHVAATTGVPEILTKPIDAADLLGTLQRARGK